MGATPRILLVDDEPDVRALVANVLVEAGFEIEQAADGGEALQLIAAGGRFDVLLTDIRMPGIDGFELVRRARETRPEIRALFMSGYATEYHMDPARDDFIGKPFRPRELLGCVYELMRRGTEQDDRPAP